MIRQFASQMSLAEKEALANDLKSMIAEELAAAPGEPRRCPHCGSPSFVRKGRGPDGSQRWLCRGCARTFSAKTKGLIARSKLPLGTWMAFAECMADALPLRECAERCGVGLATAWFMRMRACECMAARLAPFRAEGRCQIDSTYLDENLSGNHSKSPSFSMPRAPRKNGRGVRRSGISNDKVCVSCGVNELGDSFCDLGCRGRESIEDVAAMLAGKVGGASTVATDRHTSYVKGLARLGAAHERHDPAEGFGPLNLVNALHSRLKAFLAPFNGVSTRRLQNYLDWFCYREQFRNPEADKRRALFLDVSEGRYETTRRGCALTPHPFMDYWEGSMSILA